MTEPKAWYCPSCNAYHGPHVETCPGGGTGTIGRMPFYTPYTSAPFERQCPNGCKGNVCMNVACPLKDSDFGRLQATAVATRVVNFTGAQG